MNDTEVFVVKGETDNTTLITWSWLKTVGKVEWMMVMDVLGLPYTEVSTSGEEPCQARWDEFMERFRYKIQKKLMGLYWLEVENCEKELSALRRTSIWYDNRH